MTAVRIASLLASATEILCALELGDYVVAVSHECDFPEDVRRKPRATRTRVAADAPSREIDEQVKAACSAGQPLYELNISMLVELRPDLIVTQAQCDVCAVRYADVEAAVQQNPNLSHARIVSLNPMTLDAVFDDILRVGDATGASDRAHSYVESLRHRVEVIRMQSRGIPRKRVACIEWIDPPMLSGNWMPELIELAGGTCDLVCAGRHSAYANWSDVVEFDPEVVVVMPCGFDLERTLAECPSLNSLPDWDKLSAVRNKRVYAVDGNAYFNRSGPRLVESLEILFELICGSMTCRPGVATRVTFPERPSAAVAPKGAEGPLT